MCVEECHLWWSLKISRTVEIIENLIGNELDKCGSGRIYNSVHFKFAILCFPVFGIFNVLDIRI